METLMSPRNEYLLQPGLGDLHKTTMEWLSQIEFWKTEMKFLRKLLDQQFLKIPKSSAKLNMLYDLEKKVKLFSSGILRQINNEILVHEAQLASLLENSFSQDEQSYREEHAKFANSIQSFLLSYHKLKTEIFTFVENNIKQTKK